MPCGCEDEEKEKIELRFIGGSHKSGRERGPFRSFETNKIYEVPPEYVQLPYWEDPEKEIEEMTEVDEYLSASTESESTGLREWRNTPLTEEDFIIGMDEEMLKAFIVAQGKKVDGRWGVNRLREEALKLQ